MILLQGVVSCSAAVPDADQFAIIMISHKKKTLGVRRRVLGAVMRRRASERGPGVIGDGAFLNDLNRFESG